MVFPIIDKHSPMTESILLKEKKPWRLVLNNPSNMHAQLRSEARPLSLYSKLPLAPFIQVREMRQNLDNAAVALC